MIFKIAIIIALLLVIFSLGSALVYLVKDQGQGNRVVKALTWRIVLSLALFTLLFLAYYLGWVTPN